MLFNKDYQEIIEKPLADFAKKLNDSLTLELYSICEDIKDKIVEKPKYDESI